MTDNQTIGDVPDEAGGITEAVPFSVGTALREEREHQGLSVDEISHRIKFAPRQIESLESDDFAHLPETTFLRGFVRSYARLLHLDDAPLLAALPHAPEQPFSVEAKALTEVPFPDIYTERRQNIIWLSAALAVAVVLGFSAWLLGGKPKEQSVPETIAPVAQNTVVETLPIPVSAVTEAEKITPVEDKNIAEKSNPEQLAVGKPVTEKPSVEKPVIAKPIVEKADKEKPDTEKPAKEKLVAEKQGVEKPVIAKPFVEKSVSVKEMTGTEKPAKDKSVAEKPIKDKLASEKTSKEKSVVDKPDAEMKKVAETKNALKEVPSTVSLVKQVAKPATANVPSGQSAIRMTFDADSWVEITDNSGKLLLSQVNHAGTEQVVNGSPPFLLVIGYAKAAHLYYKGKAVDLAPHTKTEVAHLTLE